MLQKKVIIDLPFVYTVNKFELDGQTYIAAGSEKDSNNCLVNIDDIEKFESVDGPGGMMSIMPIPGKNNQLVSVMGLFPPFIGAEAGIFLHEKIKEEWKARKVIPLPFLHRCEILTVEGTNHLLAATVSIHKADPSDWSKPGKLYHVDMDSNEPDNWKPVQIFENLFRNHGMNKYKIGNTEMVCISGDKGIFSIQPEKNGNWQIDQLFDQEVSEFAFYDLDNDGTDELVTIEPFHGNQLKIYKKRNNKWDAIYNSPLSFGHGLSVGKFKDKNIIVVGNRRGTCNLEMHQFNAVNKIEKVIIEEDTGPTQTMVFNYKGVDYILSSNQKKNEVVIYN